MKSKGKGVLKNVYGYFLPSAWRQAKGYFLVRILKIAVTSVLPFLSIFFLPKIIEELMGSKDPQVLMRYALTMILLEFGLNFLNGTLGNLIERYAQMFENYYKVVLSERIMEMDFQKTEDKKALDQLELAKNGMAWYSGGLNGLMDPLFDMISRVIVLAGAASIIVSKAPVLLLLTLVALIFTGIVNHKSNQIEQEGYAELSKINRVFGYLGFELADFRYGKDIRLYDSKDMMIEKWSHYTEKLNYWSEDIANRHLPLSLLNVLAGLLRDAGTYFYLGFLAIMGKISIASCTQMINSASVFTGSLEQILNNYLTMIKRANYANEFVKFVEQFSAETFSVETSSAETSSEGSLSEKTSSEESLSEELSFAEVSSAESFSAGQGKSAHRESGSREIRKQKSGSLPVQPGEHVFEFREVSFAYPGTDTLVLNRMNLRIREGEHLSVVGLNGAGKTTLVKLLCRLYDPTEGEILMDGVNIREYDYRQYMEVFAPVFQDFKLFLFSVKENLLLKDTFSDEEEEKAVRALEKVGIGEKIRSFKNGIDTTLFRQFDEEGVEPSGGEQQKLAIARALIKDAPVVVLDEPTAALDPIAEYEIYRQFEDLVKGKTAIYISHRLSSCQFCDRIAVVSEGRIVECGTHSELAGKADGLYAKMFAAQAQYYVG